MALHLAPLNQLPEFLDLRREGSDIALDFLELASPSVTLAGEPTLRLSLTVECGPLGRQRSLEAAERRPKLAQLLPRMTQPALQRRDQVTFEVVLLVGR